MPSLSDSAPHGSDACGLPDASRIPAYQPRTARGSEHDRLLKGLLYDASDRELVDLRERAADLCDRFNALPRGDGMGRRGVLDSLFPGHGGHLDITGPLHVDYGVHTTIGERVYANFSLTILDCAPVTIGDDVLIGPNVSLLAAMHPLRWQDRNVRIAPDGHTYDHEYGRPIAIGPNCWLGGGVTVLGGVTIGEGSVIGAGAVVTHDIPAGSVAVGSPARVLRHIGDGDAAEFQDYAR